MTLCVFYVVAEQDGYATQKCDHCGRSVRTRASHVGKTYAKCRNPRAFGNSSGGPGTELKLLLARFGVTASPGCSCNAKAKLMDAHGCAWCEANIETIVDWLQDEASRRKLPFVKAVGRALVRRAIRNARRVATRT